MSTKDISRKQEKVRERGEGGCRDRWGGGGGRGERGGGKEGVVFYTYSLTHLWFRFGLNIHTG